jgi:pyrimidine deaminase RibD-like protein
MRASDYEISNFDKLDNVLVKLCRMVIEGQKNNPEYYGMVAAAVIDNDNNIVASLNVPAGEKRMHAEHAAINAYKEKYGEPEAGSIVVTTCSPCNEEMSERYGESCTDLINSSDIRKVYCGFHDPSQSNDHNKFTLKVTDNKQINELCKQFANTFL